MNEDKNLSRRITVFVKNNMNTIILILICVSYVLYGMLTVEETGKTIQEIIGSGALSALAGFLIKTSRAKSGIIDGMNSQMFIIKTNAYGKKKEEITPFIDEIPQFCDYKNEARLKQKQSEYLAKYAMKYELFVSGYYDKDPKKQEILKKIRSIKVYQYTPITFTNAYDNTTKEDELLSANVKKYNRSNNTIKVLATVVCGILFGYYTFSYSFDWAHIIWALFQVAVYLIMGQIDYNNSYYFVTQTLRGKIERVITILDEFINLRREYPGIFTLKIETETEEQNNKNKDTVEVIPNSNSELEEDT